LRRQSSDFARGRAPVFEALRRARHLELGEPAWGRSCGEMPRKCRLTPGALRPAFPNWLPRHYRRPRCAIVHRISAGSGLFAGPLPCIEKLARRLRWRSSATTAAPPSEITGRLHSMPICGAGADGLRARRLSPRGIRRLGRNACRKSNRFKAALRLICILISGAKITRLPRRLKDPYSGGWTPGGITAMRFTMKTGASLRVGSDREGGIVVPSGSPRRFALRAGPASKVDVYGRGPGG